MIFKDEIKKDSTLTLLYENYKKRGFKIEELLKTSNTMIKDFLESCYFLELIEKHREEIKYNNLLKVQLDSKGQKEINKKIDIYMEEIRKIEEM